MGEERCTQATKIKVCKAVILATLLYACETWTVYRRHASQLNRFHLTCLHRVLRVRWQDKIPDTEILKHTNLPSIHTQLKRAPLHWAGHVLKMPDHRIPKQLLCVVNFVKNSAVGKNQAKIQGHIESLPEEL